MLLKDRVAVVTGGGSRRGLGRAIAAMFAEHGAQVAVLDLDGAAAAAVAGELPGAGHLGLSCDVTQRDQCDAAIDQTRAAFDRIDILVNNAGISSPTTFFEVDDALYDRVMDVNMRGTLHMTQGVARHMVAARRGSIINIASVAGQIGGGLFGKSAYAAAKAAILGYTKATARELGPDNIRANAICPGLIDTDIFAGGLSEQRRAEIIATTRLGRIGRPAEVAGCALFLASDLSSYVTGSEVDVNGGSHIH